MAIKWRHFKSPWNFDSILEFWQPQSWEWLKLVKSRNLIHFKILTQISDFWLIVLRSIDFGQIKNILSRVEILTQIWEVWPPWTCEWWNLAKSRHFEMHWNFGSNLRLDYPCPALDEIWPNQEILSHIESLTQIWDCWPPWPTRCWNWQNQKSFESHWNFNSKWRFFTSLVLWTMKFDQIIHFKSPWNFCSIWEFWSPCWSREW